MSFFMLYRIIDIGVYSSSLCMLNVVNSSLDVLREKFSDLCWSTQIKFMNKKKAMISSQE